MKKKLVLIFLIFISGKLIGQISISSSNAFIQLGSGVPCRANNPNPRIYINGTYNLSSVQFNGRNQYILTLPFSNSTFVCLHGFNYLNIASNSHLRIRWSGSQWVLGFILVGNTFQNIAVFNGDTPLPKCGSISTAFSATINGEDCFCKPSLNLSGAISSNISRASQTEIISNQTIGSIYKQYYQAGNGILLENGFQVATGGVFEAKIEACN